MGHIPYRQFVIAVRWEPIRGTKGERGEYIVEAWDHRLPQSWHRKWRLFRQELPEFQRRTDEMRWAVDELHDRLQADTRTPQGARRRIDLARIQRQADEVTWQWA